MTELGIVAASGVCSKAECTASEAGPCLVGTADKIDCEFFELTDVESTVNVPPRSGLPLFDGEALRIDELERALKSLPASVVVPMGRVDAGKTTLVAVCFHLLRSRRLAAWRFAGSETIIGFARRAHHASYRSRGTQPLTPRTEKDESGLHLHVHMRKPTDGQRRSIVIVDLSGEHVEEFADGTDVPVVSQSLARATHIPVVVDGRRLADPDTRVLEVIEARTLLKMIERHGVAERAVVSLVVAKRDLLDDLNLPEVVNAIVRGTLAEPSEWFVTADRPSKEADNDDEPLVTLGYGVDRFVDHLAESSHRDEQPKEVLRQPNSSAALQHYWVKVP